jgi:predicted dinucleotide-binding enzyme
MRIGIVGSGHIGGTAAQLFARAGHEVARLVEEIGFAPVDTGKLREGGRLQQAGGPLYTQVLSGSDAEGVLHREQAQGQGAAPLS